MLTLEDVLYHSGLPLELVVPGDITAPIRWVHTTEDPNPSRFLEGGELILSAGVWLAAGYQPEAFVRGLHSIGVVGLGYGVDHDGGEIPQAVVSSCRTQALPLFAVPQDVPFIALSRLFFDDVHEEREARLKTALARSEALLAASTAGGGLAGLLRAVQQLLPPLAVVASGGTIIASAETGGSHFESDDRVSSEGNIAEFDISVTDRQDLRLVVAAAASDLTADDRAVIHQILPFLALELAQQRARREADRRLTAELVDLLIAGEHRHAITRATALGLDPTAPSVAVIALSPTPEQDLQPLEYAIRRSGLPALVTTRGDSLVALLQPGEPGPLLADIAAAVTADLPPQISLGFGDIVEDVPSLRRSLLRAQQVARLATARDDRRYALADEGASHSLLLASLTEDELQALSDPLLLPLVEYDASHNVRLMETLHTFLATDCSWNKAADRLFVHVNTLRHRIATIERLTGRSFSSLGDRVDFFLAVRSAGLLRSSPDARARIRQAAT